MWRRHLPFEVSLLISLLVHAGMLGGWQQRALRPLVEWAEKVATGHNPAKAGELTVPVITFVDVVEPAPATPPPRMFIETDPSQVTGEEPKQAQFYSDKPTVAANPENPTGQEGATPYLAGTQTRVMSTEDVPFTRPGGQSPPVAPLVPAPEVAPLPPAQTEPPKNVAETGEKTVTQIAKNDVTAETLLGWKAAPPAATEGGSPAGREVAAAKARLTASGTLRTGIAAFNVAASPFGAYDQKVVRAVQSRWYALIDQYGVYERAGEVTVYFELYDDGTVHHMRLAENTAGEILALYCKRAIVESAPFDALPEHLQMLVGKEPREVNFTFYY